MALYGKVASNKVLHELIDIPEEKIYGLGWPIGSVPTADYFRKSSSSYLLKSQIQQLVRTKKGERVMLPDFGLDLENYLFDPLTSDKTVQIVASIKKAITLYAPNVILLKARVIQDENIKGYGMPGLLITLTVMGTLQKQTLDVDIII